MLYSLATALGSRADVGSCCTFACVENKDTSTFFVAHFCTRASQQPRKLARYQMLLYHDGGGDRYWRLRHERVLYRNTLQCLEYFVSNVHPDRFRFSLFPTCFSTSTWRQK